MLGLLGFLLVATAQVSNMILARGVAGSVPPFSIAFFRWSIVALGLLPAVVMALREKPGVLRGQTPGIVLAGFFGMFVCGGPVYVAGVTTSAINLSLIMALAPLVVLLFSFVSGQEAIHRNQIIGMLLSLVGAAVIITKGQGTFGSGVAIGDLLVTMAMLGWAGYTLLQNRVGSGVSFWRGLACSPRQARCSRCPLPSMKCGPRHQPRSVGVRRWSISSQDWSPASLPIRPTPGSARSSARCRHR